LTVYFFAAVSVARRRSRARPASHQTGGLPGLADQAQAGAQEVAQTPALLGVGVSEGEVAAPEQPGDGLGVVAVALGLLAVDGFHPPGVAQREGDVLVAAGVGQPVPAVHALAADDEALAEGRDGFEERPGGGSQGNRTSGP
jgi:hypothetical protein